MTRYDIMGVPVAAPRTPREHIKAWLVARVDDAIDHDEYVEEVVFPVFVAVWLTVPIGVAVHATVAGWSLPLLGAAMGLLLCPVALLVMMFKAVLWDEDRDTRRQLAAQAKAKNAREYDLLVRGGTIR